MSNWAERRASDTEQHLDVETRIKINAWLRVLPRRDDQVLHKLESLFLSIAAGDRIHFDALPSSFEEFHLTSNRPDLVPCNSVQQAVRFLGALPLNHLWEIDPSNRPRLHDILKVSMAIHPSARSSDRMASHSSPVASIKDAETYPSMAKLRESVQFWHFDWAYRPWKIAFSNRTARVGKRHCFRRRTDEVAIGCREQTFRPNLGGLCSSLVLSAR